jgi:hypothetical protein
MDNPVSNFIDGRSSPALPVRQVATNVTDAKRSARNLKVVKDKAEAKSEPPPRKRSMLAIPEDSIA